MPLTIDPKLIEALAQRPAAEVQQAPALDSHNGPSALAKAIYTAGGSADAASTLYGLHTGKVQEADPLVNWAPKNAQVPLGAGLEVGSLLLLNRILGKSHPNLVNAAMMALGATHGGLAVANMHTIASAKK